MLSVKECLPCHKLMVLAFLEDYDQVTKQQSIDLLDKILTGRSNYNVMNEYMSSENNLKSMINLLKDKSKYIQFNHFMSSSLLTHHLPRYTQACRRLLAECKTTLKLVGDELASLDAFEFAYTGNLSKDKSKNI
ncbi:uncharacterized protein MELLADRAFT_93962 [Melampsora larici-populina 98AG31]|uniref:Uncharacterized protein n=1 Tax=Melampsora larici-populina (strain 98AG31 / pathotype 3-4-7) TaxID=747676 RepID=F4S5X0_MELLP|nr:uncharacterized protein MELLADRAFT_93962 [Melampsora larici-populina 98AG31]EGF99993.1 hypothetical protein MELLADRAFT_93962 [Melampsora larici-populina 98AG31]